MTELSREDVLYILDIVDRSHFDFFELERGDLKVTVSKNGRDAMAPHGSLPQEDRGVPDRDPASPPSPESSPAVAVAPDRSPTQAPAVVSHRSEDGLLPVKAPMVGIFYAQAEPGAPPYVEMGSSVDEDTTLGLIEVMKVFNTVRAARRGAVAEILVENGQLVEFGQTLFLIRPDESPNGERS